MAKDAKAEVDKAAKNTEKGLNEAVDKFDKNVTEVSFLIFQWTLKTSAVWWW